MPIRKESIKLYGRVTGRHSYGGTHVHGFLSHRSARGEQILARKKCALPAQAVQNAVLVPA